VSGSLAVAGQVPLTTHFQVHPGHLCCAFHLYLPSLSPLPLSPCPCPCPCSPCCACSITHVVSQSDILRFVLKRLGGLSSEWPLAGISLADMGFTAAPVICVPQEMSTINALATMVVSGRRGWWW
jgi:hypothetical protein